MVMEVYKREREDLKKPWSRPRSMAWRALVGFQASIMLLMALVFGSSLLDVGKDSLPTLLGNGLSLSGTTNDVVEFFSGTFFCHFMPLQRIGMCVCGYLEHNSSSVVWASIFVRDAFPEDGSGLVFHHA